MSRRPFLAISLSLVAASTAAAPHLQDAVQRIPKALSLREAVPPEPGTVRMIVELEHAPIASDYERMRELGVELIQPVEGSRAVVRGTPAAVERLREWGLVREATAVRPDDRVHTTAIRALADGSAARLRVSFHADVPLERAEEAIRAAGAWPAQALPTRFGPLRSLEVFGSHREVERLALDEAVLLIHGPEGEIDPMNSQAADVSNVTPLFEAPYGLTGSGVVIGVLDVGNAQASHPEFEGRVIAHSGADAALHPTHVTGTIASGGVVQARSKGMAPAATVHQFSHSAGFLQQKFDEIGANFIAADNNSWGFITGWSRDDSRTTPWGWYGNVAFGGYSDTSAGIDEIARATGALVMFSNGNDGGESGPSSFPFEHIHRVVSSDRDEIWCMSNDGSGTDCPSTPCGTRCEAEKHPSDGTFRNASRTASAKNAIGVGAVGSSKSIAGFSSRGPTRDGRIKPDLVAKGQSQFSTSTGSGYSVLQGTSMSTPVVTGIAALLVEQWRNTTGGQPGGDLLKALLIHGAQDLGNPGPDYTYGFGLVDARASIDVILADGGTGARIQRGSLAQGESVEYLLELSAGSAVRATLAWFDPFSVPFPTLETTLINDLDLHVVAPDGSILGAWVLDPDQETAPATRGTNTRDTVEQVEFTADQTGIYRAVVRGSSLLGEGAQEFALVLSHPIAGYAPGCFDPFEPNDAPGNAWGRLISGRVLGARLCTGADVDHYRFVVDRSGPLSVTVGSEATVPLRVALLGGELGESSIVILPGQDGTIWAVLGTGSGQTIAPTELVVRISADAPVEGESAYSLITSYQSSTPGRQRAARRP
ncbi:MAG TPA: S8 family serine peptidase [Thermoanaerobaculia bacterium]|nr:S8 family serine peptidase [Thermoanaerobaculia bacterium]